MTMDLGMSERVAPLVEKIRDFARNFVAPLNEEFDSLIGTGPNGRFSCLLYTSPSPRDRG